MEIPKLFTEKVNKFNLRVMKRRRSWRDF